MSEKIIAVSAGREITETEFNEFLSKLPEQQQAYVATEEGRKQVCELLLIRKTWI